MILALSLLPPLITHRVYLIINSGIIIKIRISSTLTITHRFYLLKELLLQPSSNKTWCYFWSGKKWEKRESERERKGERWRDVMMMVMISACWVRQLLHSEGLKTVPTIPCSSSYHLVLSEPNHLLHNHFILQNIDISHATVTHTHTHT